MTTKKTLVRLMTKAIKTEEEMVTIYANHGILFSECLELDSSIREKIVNTLLSLREGSRKHREKLQDIINTI